MIEPSFTDDLRLLANALRTEGFRFILVRHNRFSIYRDISTWLREQFANRSIVEFHFEGKDYRTIIDFIRNAGSSIILIPDFDWLFREGNESICVGFNQRRDALAQLPVALVCFVQPSTLRLVSKRLPDWWSLRSMELEFVSEEVANTPDLLKLEDEVSSIGGGTRKEKEAELHRLLLNIEISDPRNKKLLLLLNSAVGQIFFDLSDYDMALIYWEESLRLSRLIKDRYSEGSLLNNISQVLKIQGKLPQAIEYLTQSLNIHDAIGSAPNKDVLFNNLGQIYSSMGDYNKALEYLNKSFVLQEQEGNAKGTSSTLINLAGVARSKNDYESAFQYLHNSLRIAMETGDRKTEGGALNGLAVLSFDKGDFDMALKYWTESLQIRREIGDRNGEGITLSNISQIYSAKGDFEGALRYLYESLKVEQEIGNIYGIATASSNIGAVFFQMDQIEKAILMLLKAKNLLLKIASPDMRLPERNLSAIIEKIGQTRFVEIVSHLPPDELGEV